MEGFIEIISITGLLDNSQSRAIINYETFRANKIIFTINNFKTFTLLYKREKEKKTDM